MRVKVRATFGAVGFMLSFALVGTTFAQMLVGSYEVGDGPDWTTNPPTYNCLEACALLFGGVAAEYQCSTTSASIDNQAFVSGWDDGQFCDTPVSETLKQNDFYDCGSTGCSYSAYVEDHCTDGETNYCFGGPVTRAVPAMSVPVLSLLTLLLLTVGISRRQSSTRSVSPRR